MPLISINMATPINRESRIYFLPDPEIESITTQTGITENSNRKYMYLKIFELVFAVALIIPFLLGVKATESTVQDMLLCICFGGIIVYPVLYLITPLSIEKNAITLITCNCVAGFILIIVGTVIVCSWWSIQFALDEANRSKPEIYIEGQHCANMKLISSLGTYITGLVYIPETIIMALEYKGYI